MDQRHRTTARLRLDAVVPGDIEEHWTLLSDPGVWAHLPSGVHTDRQRTAATVEAAVAQWAGTGLGYWSARLRTDLPPGALPERLGPGRFVGIGGCAVRDGADWWNLYYRLTPPAWGLGLAAEMVAASLDAAHTVRPELPVVAYLLEHNVESRGRAERSGLTLAWRGPDAGNPDPDAVRLVYADRPLDDDVLARITARP